MNRTFLLGIILLFCACNDASTTQVAEAPVGPSVNPSPAPTPRLFLVGDNMLYPQSVTDQFSNALGIDIINDSGDRVSEVGNIVWGGERDYSSLDNGGSILFGQNDTFIVMQGIENVLVFDTTDDGSAQLMIWGKQFIDSLLSTGATVYLATIPHLPSQGYTIFSSAYGGSDAEVDSFSQTLRDYVTSKNDPHLILVDVNQLMSTDNYEADGYALTPDGETELINIFLNALGS